MIGNATTNAKPLRNGGAVELMLDNGMSIHLNTSLHGNCIHIDVYGTDHECCKDILLDLTALDKKNHGHRRMERIH